MPILYMEFYIQYAVRIVFKILKHASFCICDHMRFYWIACRERWEKCVVRVSPIIIWRYIYNNFECYRFFVGSEIHQIAFGKRDFFNLSKLNVNSCACESIFIYLHYLQIIQSDKTIVFLHGHLYTNSV